MKIAVVSDIHSNITALESVINALKEEEIDFFLCSGDTVGYGPHPNQVCEALRKIKNLVCVKGNHDEAVLKGDFSRLNPIAAEAAQWTREKMKKENLNFLSRLKEIEPLKMDTLNILMVHGSPRDPLYEYILPTASSSLLEQFLEDSRADIIIMGHTHIPFVKNFGYKAVINAGSVGQPRDNNPRASYALIDTITGEISIKRVAYDIDLVAEDIKKTALPKELADRLYYGR